MRWQIKTITFSREFSHEDDPFRCRATLRVVLSDTRVALFDKCLWRILFAALLRLRPFVSIVLNLLPQAVFIQVLNLLHCRVIGASMGFNSGLTLQFKQSLGTTSKQINITAISVCIKKQEIFSALKHWLKITCSELGAGSIFKIHSPTKQRHFDNRVFGMCALNRLFYPHIKLRYYHLAIRVELPLALFWYANDNCRAALGERLKIKTCPIPIRIHRAHVMAFDSGGLLITTASDRVSHFLLFIAILVL